MRVLGIDYGSKRVGIALGDTESKIATPWATVPNEGSLALLARIHELAARDQVEAIVVGVPRPLKNSKLENQQVLETKTFIASLRGIDLKVFEEDETLTSKLAARQVEERGEKGKRDDLAAANILQTWLDKQ